MKINEVFDTVSGTLLEESFKDFERIWDRFEEESGNKLNTEKIDFAKAGGANAGGPNAEAFFVSVVNQYTIINRGTVLHTAQQVLGKQYHKTSALITDLLRKKLVFNNEKYYERISGYTRYIDPRAAKFTDVSNLIKAVTMVEGDMGFKKGRLYKMVLETVFADLVRMAYKRVKKSNESQYDVLYKSQSIVVFKPNTREASCKLGAGTKWCTAAKRGNAFDSYKDSGDLFYFVINNGGGTEKYAVFVYKSSPDYEIFDERDSKMKSITFTSTLLSLIGVEETKRLLNNFEKKAQNNTTKLFTMEIGKMVKRLGEGDTGDMFKTLRETFKIGIDVEPEEGTFYIKNGTRNGDLEVTEVIDTGVYVDGGAGVVLKGRGKARDDILEAIDGASSLLKIDAAFSSADVDRRYKSSAISVERLESIVVQYFKLEVGRVLDLVPDRLIELKHILQGVMMVLINKQTV